MRPDIIASNFDIFNIENDERSDSDSSMYLYLDDVKRPDKNHKGSNNTLVIMGVIGLVFLGIIALCLLFSPLVPHNTDVNINTSDDSTWDDIAYRLDRYGGTIYVSSGSSYTVSTSYDVSYSSGLLRVDDTYYNVDHIMRIIIH